MLVLHALPLTYCMLRKEINSPPPQSLGFSKCNTSLKSCVVTDKMSCVIADDKCYGVSVCTSGRQAQEFGLLCVCTKHEFLFVVGFTKQNSIGHLCSL